MPITEAGLPFSGNTPASRHSSWTGAKRAEETATAKKAEYLDLLQRQGPMTDNEVHDLTGWPLSSVNSIRNLCGTRVVSHAHVRHYWSSGRSTTRTLWRIEE